MSLPPEFDHAIYTNHPENEDIASFDEVEALAHYKRFGMEEGRVCSEVNCREKFLDLVPASDSLLEIGPFFSPAFCRPEYDVFYLDCLSEESMRERAEQIEGAQGETIPHIDYLWSGQSYADLVNREFPAIFSAHNAEHQPCLITHLQDLESVLQKDGAVFFALPDKRYCFDSFFPETILSDILDAWSNHSTRHRLKDILDHRLFTTHNDPARHWRGDHGLDRHGVPLGVDEQAVVFEELQRYSETEEYNDVHAWKFTPAAFRIVLDNLFLLKFTDLKIERLYPTVKDSNEFYAVLMRGR